MSTRLGQWLLLSCTLAVACAPDAPVQTHQWLALGTVFEITIAAPPAQWRDTVAPRVEAVLDPWSADMYPYRDGELAQANQRFASGGCVLPSPLLRQLIDTARALETQHGDRFVPALAELTTLWRLHEAEQQDWKKPQDADIDEAIRPQPSATNVFDDGDQLCARGPAALDFGGFAKGLIVDELVDALDAEGLQNAIVNAGGDLKVRGARNGEAWRVAVRNPFGSGALAGILARDGDAIFTSGNYERYVMLDGQRYGHILDPATGRPLRGVASVTVIGQDATQTDAAATALYVAASRELAASGGLANVPTVPGAEAYLILDEQGVAWLNPAMADRIQWVDKPQTKIIVDQNRAR
ncbi:MAG: FAD:protein FMN transferase [Gammaproteobacteria bacterium]